MYKNHPSMVALLGSCLKRVRIQAGEGEVGNRSCSIEKARTPTEPLLEYVVYSDGMSLASA